ncbi:MAG: hypothetical protein HY673_25525 [Chloroflexi bacterium]|nr:hypothetical protein [Chloroflexota bacterium]
MVQPAWIILGAVGVVVLGLIFWFWIKGLALIKDDEVGILNKKMFGKKMPEGQIVARQGEIGIQADILMPGLYWRNPIAWKIEKVEVTDVDPDEVGIVESIDGVPIPTGRFLGDEVACNSYQDASRFLERGGMKGPNVAILRPGTYRINTRVFNITKQPVTDIPKETVGVVVALDGVPLPSGYIFQGTPLLRRTGEKLPLLGRQVVRPQYLERQRQPVAQAHGLVDRGPPALPD